MYEISEKQSARIKEEMMGCGSFEWSRNNPDKVILSPNLIKLLELDIEIDEDNRITMDVEALENILSEQSYKELLDWTHYNMDQGKEQFDYSNQMKLTNGHMVQFSYRVRCIYNREGEMTNLLGVISDQHYNNQRDYSTRLNNEKFYRLFGDAPIGIAMLRVDGTCFLCNDSLIECVVYQEYELKDMPFDSLIHEEDQHNFVSLYQSLLNNKMNSFRNEFRIVSKNGEKIWHDITVTVVKDPYNQMKYLIVMMQPSLRNKKQSARKGLINSIKEELMDLSLRDSLSGLYNRQYALRKLRELILIFYEKHLSFSALLIDVDHIKVINDKYGHSCGDKVIHDLSEIFKALTRETDICARWGGEEFIILFPELDGKTAYELAQRLQSDVNDMIIMWEGKEIQVTVSITITSYTSDDSLKGFINKLDRALYEDKGAERGQIRQI